MKNILEKLSYTSRQYINLVSSNNETTINEYETCIKFLIKKLISNINLVEFLILHEKSSPKEIIQLITEICPQILSPIFSPVIKQGYLISAYGISNELNSFDTEDKIFNLFDSIINKIYYIYTEGKDFHEDFMIPYYFYHYAISGLIVISGLNTVEQKTFLQHFKKQSIEKIIDSVLGLNLIIKIANDNNTIIPQDIIQKYNHIRDNFLLNLQEQKIIEEYLDNELFQGKKEIFYQNFLYLKDNIACIINLFNIANKKSSTDILKTASIKIFQYMHDKRIELQEDDVSWNYSLFNISSLKILNLLNQNTPIDSITDVTLYKEFQTSLSNIKMKKTEIACKKSTIPKPQESMANLEKNPHNNHGINFTCLIQIEGENKNENLNKQILMGTQDDFEFCIHVKNSNENNEFLKFYDTNFLDFFGTEYSQFKTIVDIDSCYKKIYELSSLHSKEIDVNDIKKLGLIDTNINKYSVTKALYFIKESIANPLSPNKSISITDICPELEETHALISHIYETNAPLLSKNTELIDKVLIFIIISSPNNYFNDKIIPSLENVDWKPLYKEICKSDIIIHKKIIEKFINKNFPSTTPISLNLLLEKFIDIAFTNKITSDEFINLAKAMFAKEELLFASQKIQEAFEKTFSFENIHIPQQHENIYMPQQQFNDQVPIKEVIGNSIEDSSIFQEFPDY